MTRNTLLLVGVVLYLFWSQSNGKVELHEGAHAPNKPIQSAITNAAAFSHQDITIQPMAQFVVTAKVLSKERYRYDNGADISSFDFALGWGNMSDQQIVDQFDIRQSGRWYYWYSDEFVLPQDEIIQSSANMHLIHKDKGIKKQLAKVREGQIVQLKGFLVNVIYPNGGEWKSSLTRRDTGDGACEVFFVEEVSIVL